MDQEKFKKINYELIETFLSAGKLCLDLRKEGLTEELKKDSTPVTNGDLEVNKILVERGYGELMIISPNNKYEEEFEILEEEARKVKAGIWGICL